LKPIDYRVYAVEDRNDNQLYDPGVDQVAFLDRAYNPASMPDFAIWYDSLRHYVSAEPQLYLRMFTDRAFRRQLLAMSERPLQHRAMLYFGAPHPKVEELLFDSIPSERVIWDPQTLGRDTVALWFDMPPEALPDTIRGRITYYKHDTVNRLQPVTETLTLPWRRIETKAEEREREKLERARRKAEEAGEEWTEPARPNPFAYELSLKGEVNPEEHLVVDFDYPLRSIDSARLLLTRTLDDGTIEDLPVRMERDTAQLRRWRILAPWKLEGDYTLTLPEGVFTDIAGFSNDSIVGRYTVADPERYATVLVRVEGRDPEAKYIVQLLDAAGALKQERRDVTTGEVLFRYVPAGEVRFRVIEDLNGNGRWDTGSLVERRQPERAEIFVNDEGLDTFSTKANWEFEVTMDMRRIFAPVTMQSLSRLLDEREAQRLRREAAKRAKEGNKKNDRYDRSDRGRIDNSMNATGNMFNQFR
ncbi:MAG: hypothetical protein K2N93_00960, partial [Alistipes sp.]|nr:hypothetical protein [Alistipes sp.]